MSATQSARVSFGRRAVWRSWVYFPNALAIFPKTVPLLVYLLGYNPVIATAYSLFIVGASALVGGLKQHLKGHVDWKTVVVFGVPAIIGVSVVRKYLIPILPDTLFIVNNYHPINREINYIAHYCNFLKLDQCLEIHYYSNHDRDCSRNSL